jgi:glucokinase
MSDLSIGVDVGGTAVKLGVCDADGRVHARRTIATDPAAGPDHLLDRVAAVAGALVAETGPVRACGVGIPGPLDAERRTLLRANHLPGWTDVAIPELLSARLDLPVALENDANCAAWGESQVGVGRSAQAVVLFTLGTGVGGGVVLGGRLWAGVGGAAGALGHLVVDPAGPLCRCGQRGCLEQYASATAVARRFGRGGAEAAFEAARRGEPDALAAVAAACDALAAAAAAAIHMLQPEVVVLGGGMAAAGDSLLAPVREGVRRRVRPAWLARTRVELTALGGDAGWIGAALWAARRCRTAPGAAPRARTATGS